TLMAQEAPKGKSSAPADAPAGAAAAGGGGGWLPVIIVLVAVPALSYAMAEFVLFPKLEQRLAAAGMHPGGGEVATAPAAHGAHGGDAKGGKAGAPAAAQSYQFANIVTNLAGAMKSR